MTTSLAVHFIEISGYVSATLYDFPWPFFEGVFYQELEDGRTLQFLIFWIWNCVAGVVGCDASLLASCVDVEKRLIDQAPGSSSGTTDTGFGLPGFDHRTLCACHL